MFCKALRPCVFASIDLPLSVKYAAALLNGVALYAYLLLAGRERKRKD